MFERFTNSARSTVMVGLEQARTRGDRHIGTEHLLLATCLDKADTGTASAFARHGLTVASVEAILDRVTSAPQGPAADRDALAALGVDSDAVREAAELAFGLGALDRVRAANKRSRWFRRGRKQRRRREQAGGRQDHHLPFTPGSKAALEDSLRIALNRKDRFICSAHLALALVDSDDRAVRDILTAPDLDIDLTQLREDLTTAISDN